MQPTVPEQEQTPDTTTPEETTEQDTEPSTDTLPSDVDIEDTAAVAAALEAIPEEKLAEVVGTLIADLAKGKSAAELSAEDKRQISAAVEAVIAVGVSSDVAATLASSPEVLASVSTEQAAAVFESVDQGALTEESAAAIVDAIQGATDEIKDVFETVINVFGGAFDEYVPLGSNVSVGERRTLVAVNAVLTGTATAAMGAAAGAGSSGGAGGGGSSASTNKANDAARKPEEDEGEEPAGEIAGESDGTKIRFIYFDKEGNMHINWKNFFKKLWKETAALAFTLAGSAVVFVTLSGFTQLVALVATGIALVIHYINVMSDQGDEE
ncbi:MAG: hypothetical protein EBS91_02815 [Betaproteobacteria bacterium]|nr:hypothetical protein [Betaproteobacteria bacterium]